MKNWYRVHDWQHCTSRGSAMLNRKRFRRPGVYRDGIQRLRCNRCFGIIHERAGDFEKLEPPVIIRERKPK